METRIVKFKKIKYILSYDLDFKNSKIVLNGNEIKQIWRYENICFAPYKIESYNIWIVFYNNKPYIVEGKENMTRESFIEEYIPKAYTFPISSCFVFFLLMIPTFAISLLDYVVHSQKNIIYIVLMVCGYLLFYVFNTMPIATYKKRRILCFLSLLCHVLSGVVFIFNLYI